MTFWSVLSILLYAFNWIIAVYFVIDLIFKRHNPVKSLSWIIVLLMLPFVGIILYAYFGRNFRQTKMYSRKGLHDVKLRKEICDTQLAWLVEHEDLIPQQFAGQKKIIRLCLNNNKSLLTQYNKTKLFYTGKKALEAMLDYASKATDHIYLQSFIIENDSVGTRWKNLLIEKSKSGVDVRVIFDDFGSWHLPYTYIHALRKAGVQIIPFGKVRFPGFKAMLNYRNHRKLLIVDGIAGFLGGVNIADRYYDGGSSLQWRDTHMLIEGQAVEQLQYSFLMDWFFITHKNLKPKRKARHRIKRTPEATAVLSDTELPMNQVSLLEDDKPDHSEKQTCFMQIVSSGPDSDWADIMQLYLTLINQAQYRISLITPYFIPNETILNALRTAALGGVEVRILMPEHSDSTFVHYASLSYMTDLMEAGVEVYLYTKGFIHSKVISIDGLCCLVGSANMDNRSLEHHFEIGAIIYKPQVACEIERQFEEDMHSSRHLSLKTWAKRPKYQKVAEALTRLLSPLL